MRVDGFVEAQCAGRRLFGYSLVLLTAIIVTQVMLAAPQPAYGEYRYVIYEPRVILGNEIPLDQNRPRSIDLTYFLEAGNRYHISLVGDWVSNDTDATDYDIWVYNKNGILSRHTESAGLPEQVGNDAKNQYFLPPETGDYTFRIINDPKDSGGSDPAVFVVMQHIEMNRRYSLELVGKYNPDDQYTSKAYHAYEFDTSAEDFELFVSVPESLDMYEARVFPMANPAAQVGYYIRGIGVPTGESLTSGAPSGSYGGYNYNYAGFRFPQWTASCERNGDDMDVIFGAPLHNETELVLDDRTVFYYLVLMAEYDQGTIEFYLKTDANNPVVTLLDPGVLGYTDRSTRIEARVSSNHPLGSVWLNYTISDWDSESLVEMTEKNGVYQAEIPRQPLNKIVKYRVYALDEIDNRGSTSGSYEVKERVIPELTVNRISLYGGESITFFGTSNVANKDHVLRIQGAASKDIPVTTDTVGVFQYVYKPPVTGTFTATLIYSGDAVYHVASSIPQEFTVTKRDLTVSCALSMNPPKEKVSLTVSGSVAPALGGVPVSLVIVSPEESFVMTTTTSASGAFSASFTPNITGTWEILPQVLSTPYNSPSQGALLSVQVVPLTLPEIIIMKATEFTKPPLVALPAGLVVVALAGVEVKTGVIRGVFKNGKGKAKDEAAAAGAAKEPGAAKESAGSQETTSYKRRSARNGG